jgi:citrate synthase
VLPLSTINRHGEKGYALYRASDEEQPVTRWLGDFWEHWARLRWIDHPLLGNKIALRIRWAARHACKRLRARIAEMESQDLHCPQCGETLVTLDSTDARITLETEIARLREALRPFALPMTLANAVARAIENGPQPFVANQLPRYEDFLRAWELLGPIESDTDQEVKP